MRRRGNCGLASSTTADDVLSIVGCTANHVIERAIVVAVDTADVAPKYMRPRRGLFRGRWLDILFQRYFAACGDSADSVAGKSTVMRSQLPNRLETNNTRLPSGLSD